MPRPTYRLRRLELVMEAGAVVALSISVLLTVARFLTLDVRPLVQAASFAPYAVVGYVAAAALLLLLLLWELGRPAAVRCALALALAGVVLHVSWLAPLYLGRVSRGSPDVSLLTSNLDLGQADADVLVHTIATHRIDVVVLEEVTRDELGRLDNAGLGRLFAHRAGRADAGSKVTMVFSTYALSDVEPIAVTNGGIAVTVAAPEPFRLLGVHPANPARGTSVWSHDMRTVREAAGRAVSAGPTVVAGDFNATTDHAMFRRVLDTGLSDAAEQANSGWQPTWPTKYRRNPGRRARRSNLPDLYRPLIAIDHVLTGPGLTAVSTGTVDVPGSDHMGLIARLDRSG